MRNGADAWPCASLTLPRPRLRIPRQRVADLPPSRPRPRLDMEPDPQTRPFVQRPGPQPQGLRRIVPLAEQRTAARPAEHPAPARGGAVLPQQVVARDPAHRRRRNRYVRAERPALRLAALPAVAELH